MKEAAFMGPYKVFLVPEVSHIWTQKKVNGAMGPWVFIAHIFKIPTLGFA